MARLLFAGMNTNQYAPHLLYLWILGLLLMGLVAQVVHAQEGEHGGPNLAEPTETIIAPVPGALPTMDRLAPPPTVAAPTQADEGAQLYWLHCQPCHGDIGQGLTDEWRAQYPPEDQYCWESGCHGERPYDNGFTLPFTIPAVIGEGTLTKYPSVGALYRYTKVAMPFWKPASLTDEEYLAITAHLARAHGVWDGTPMTDDNVDGILLPASLQTGLDQSSLDSTATPPAASIGSGAISQGELILLFLGIGITALAGGIWLWQRSNH